MKNPRTVAKRIAEMHNEGLRPFGRRGEVSGEEGEYDW